MSEHASPLEERHAGRQPLLALLHLLWRLVPRRARVFFAARFSDITRTEALGYAVWGAMGIVIGVPEIWAAVAGSDFAWPTISTTVGHLQERWPVVSLIPVAMIVMSCYSVFRIGAGSATVQADFRAIARTDQGRLAQQEVSPADLANRGAPVLKGRQQWDVLPYFMFATAAVVVTALVASRSDNRFMVGYVLYSLIAIVWVVVPNVAAYRFKRDVPFTTLFFTVQCLSRRLQFVAALIAALLVILLIHLALYPWPSRG